jgi:nitrogen fixation protein FixH
MTHEKLESKKEGKKVLFALLAFFAIFSSVNAFFVYKALSTNTGVVVENAFEQGLNYNDIIAKAKAVEKQ